MMNFRSIFVLVFITCSTLLSAQKRATPEELNASKIIGFGNSVINLGNSYQESIKNYKSVISTAESNIAKIKKNPAQQLFFVQCNLTTVNASQLKEYTESLRTVPAFSTKKDIQHHVEMGEASIKAMGIWCAAISSYFSEKKFTNDSDFAQYSILQDSLNSHLSKASANWATASKLASDAGNEAEILLLKKSPLAGFIIPMKQDLLALDQIYAKLSAEDVDIPALKQEVGNLSQSASKNSDTQTKDVSKLKDIYYKEVFQNFYRSLSSATSTVDKLLDKMSEGTTTGEDLQRWYSQASSDYNKTIENYNRFVAQ